MLGHSVLECNIACLRILEKYNVNGVIDCYVDIIAWLKILGKYNCSRAISSVFKLYHGLKF